MGDEPTKSSSTVDFLEAHLSGLQVLAVDLAATVLKVFDGECTVTAAVVPLVMAAKFLAFRAGMSSEETNRLLHAVIDGVDIHELPEVPNAQGSQGVAN